MIKLYNPSRTIDVATDWGFIKDNSVDLEQALAQPIKIIALPVCCTEPWNFCYDQLIDNLDLSQFDLVLLSDIEYLTIDTIKTWAAKRGIKKFLLSLGGWHNHETLDPLCMIYRPWWAFNLMRMNQYQDTQSTSKPYLYESLLGARRPHRDFTMLKMQSLNMLDRGIVTYRDFFKGEIIDQCTEEVKQHFSNLELNWPYVSANLDPTWEVQEKLSNSISPYVPWSVYCNTWYSIVCETNAHGGSFFMSEKTAKVLFAKRLFVLLGTPGFLANLKSLGFETFSSVIDESYDLEQNHIKRYDMAVEQIIQLQQQDPVLVYKKIQPILDHNHNRLTAWPELVHQEQQLMLTTAIQNLR